MDNFKGTKGEWYLMGNEIHCDGKLIGYATNSFFKNSANDKEAKANALLMSKSPELLNALQHVLEIMYQCDPPHELHETYANAFSNYNNLIKEVTE